MALDRLTKITGPGIKTDTNWVGNNANFTGVTTTGSSFNVGVSTFHSTLAEVHNIKSTGIITATGGSFSGNVTAVDGTFTGNVSIAGTLTYEDVTNIDSVGIITAPAVDVDDFLDVGSNIKLGNAGVVTATTFSGSGASLTGIANANISASAAIAGSKINPNFGSQLIQTTGSIVGNGVQSTANLSLDSDVPTINFNDSNSENDFELKNNNGTFTLRDKDAGADRFTVSSAGQFTFATNVDFSSGIDVTGNSTFVNDIDVDGHTNLDDVSVAGIVTTTQNVGNVGIDIHATGSGRGSQIKLHNDHATSFVGISGDTDGNLLIFNQSNTDIIFATSNNARSRVDSDGHFVPESNNTFDLGSTTLGWRNVYMNDLNLSNMNGDTNDVDGTQGSWTIQEGKDDLYIINRLNGKKFKIKMEEIS